jgi:hypothetical protein
VEHIRENMEWIRNQRATRQRHKSVEGMGATLMSKRANSLRSVGQRAAQAEDDPVKLVSEERAEYCLKHCVVSGVCPVPKDEIAQLLDLVKIFEEGRERASRVARSLGNRTRGQNLKRLECSPGKWLS